MNQKSSQKVKIPSRNIVKLLLVNSFHFIDTPFKIWYHVNFTESVDQNHNVFLFRFDKILAVIIILGLKSVNCNHIALYEKLQGDIKIPN